MDRTRLSISECVLDSDAWRSKRNLFIGGANIITQSPSSIVHQAQVGDSVKKRCNQNNVLISYMPDGSDRPITTHKTQATINPRFKE